MWVLCMAEGTPEDSVSCFCFETVRADYLPNSDQTWRITRYLQVELAFFFSPMLRMVTTTLVWMTWRALWLWVGTSLWGWRN